MDYKTFNSIVEARISKTQELLVSKGMEYANADRLSHFKESAALQRVTPEQCLFGYVTKHIIALVEFISRDAIGSTTSIEQWEEKIGDIIVYMHILEAIVKESDYEDIKI